jgi:hypothetical protein
MNEHTLGFRVVGPCTGERRLVDAAAAFAAYAECDDKAKVNSEAYLSAFQFGPGFAEQLKQTGSVKGYSGSCWSPWIWWDVDRKDDLERARIDAGRLAVAVSERFAIDDDDLLAFYSGSKGFHLGMSTHFMPLALPSPDFHRIARRFAENVAVVAGVVIDTGVYDAVRCFRAPNSRHPKTGLHKRRVPVDSLLKVSAAALVDLAKAPEPFEIPDPSPGGSDFNPSADWNADAAEIKQQAEAVSQRRDAGAASLNRVTLEFIREGAGTGDRHRLCYSAAKNLAEFGCPPGLAHALLSDSALDSGLPPSEVRRQIECGLKDGAA